MPTTYDAPRGFIYLRPMFIERIAHHATSAGVKLTASNRPRAGLNLIFSHDGMLEMKMLHMCDEAFALNSSHGGVAHYSLSKCRAPMTPSPRLKINALLRQLLSQHVSFGSVRHFELDPIAVQVLAHMGNAP